ncbi:hypothetical protein HZS_3149 [Henneguya salminicola]|nr:hypothetical protein HZS_3149 [Henneguya salminicola]
MTRGSPLSNSIIALIARAHNLENSCKKIAKLFTHNRTAVLNLVKTFLLAGEIEKEARATCTPKNLTACKEMQIKGCGMKITRFL